jgi:hypothetical protein
LARQTSLGCLTYSADKTRVSILKVITTKGSSFDAAIPLHCKKGEYAQA